MDLARAIEAIEYKIATESDRFDAGSTIKMDISASWPPLAELSDALNRKYPYVSLTYDHQANDMIQLILVNKTPS